MSEMQAATVLIVCEGDHGSHKFRRTVQVFIQVQIGVVKLPWSPQKTDHGQEATILDDHVVSDEEWSAQARASVENRGAGGSPPFPARRRYMIRCPQCRIAYPVRATTMHSILDDLATRGQNTMTIRALGAKLSSKSE
jgi:hypothetical protein